uniref:EGF-like domain-containing protein n=1 Tax=Hucho hucho TaxID=62062 RepID=A0A4W5JZ34_9TELE
MGSRTVLLILGLHFSLLGILEVNGCDPGFQAKERKLCVDTDECNEWDIIPPCGSNATCYNTQGSFLCQCLPGFISTTTVNLTFSGQCNDVNECQETPQVCGSNTICSNTFGSYNCQCLPGFRVPTYTGRCEGESNKRASLCVCLLLID